MKKIVTVRHHILINHRKGHSLALNSHSSKKYSGIRGLKGVIYILTHTQIHNTWIQWSPFTLIPQLGLKTHACELVNELGIELELVSM